jgi:hypothetical protein
MNIIISGDSWGVGEWPQETNHRGIWQYFEEDGHVVEMCSIPGECNKIIINHLRNVILGIDNKIIDSHFIFWFQSDPLRDLRPFDEFGKTINNYDDLINKSKELLDITYTNLNLLNKKIYCIGGCSKLDLDLIVKYNNLIPLIPSLTEHIFDDFEHPKLWHSDWINHVHKLDIDTIDMLLNEKKKQDSLNDIQKYREYFWPDGSHPNRKGHKILYEFICESLNIT